MRSIARDEHLRVQFTSRQESGVLVYSVLVAFEGQGVEPQRFALRERMEYPTLRATAKDLDRVRPRIEEHSLS
jgi:hypothetical protein